MGPTVLYRQCAGDAAHQHRVFLSGVLYQATVPRFPLGNYGPCLYADAGAHAAQKVPCCDDLTMAGAPRRMLRVAALMSNVRAGTPPFRPITSRATAIASGVRSGAVAGHGAVRC